MMKTPFPTTGRSAVALAAAMLLTACASSPPEVAMSVDMPPAFAETGAVQPADRWWTSFEDEGLNTAIELAMTDSLTLAATWDRLAQAEAIARREGAPLLPAVNGELSAGRSRTERGGDVDYANSFLAGLAVSYEVDLWGRVRAGHEAAAYDVASRQRDVQAAAMTLAASVATTWYQLAEAQGQVRIIDEQTDLNQNVLDLVTERFRQGQVQAADVLRQRQLIEQTQGLRSQSQRRAQVLEHQLAVLLGRPPRSDLALPPPNLAALPPLPATGVPAELMQRRPDVLAAYYAVLSEDRSLAQAIAARYPRISLSARLQTSGADVRDLFDDWLASLAANLTHPLFDNGELQAEEDFSRAQLSESLRDYRQSVLVALREVEDALTSERYQSQYLASLKQQLATADDVIERTRASYINGQLDYVRVLDALTSRQSLERTYLAAQRERIEFRIQLYRAIAGDVPLDRPDLARLDDAAVTHGDAASAEQ
jgi:NodT family efflux transporter outer membrane factor (OMF) lipoprotein